MKSKDAAPQNGIPENIVIEQDDETADSHNEIIICGDESFNSVDGHVPDLPSLNSKSPTIQLK